jgi:hypothetical protein
LPFSFIQFSPFGTQEKILNQVLDRNQLMRLYRARRMTAFRSTSAWTPLGPRFPKRAFSFFSGNKTRPDTNLCPMARSPEMFSIQQMRGNRLLTAVCTLFLSLYLCVLLPAHHHSDGQEHADCSLCVAQHQPSIAECTFSMPAAAIPSEAIHFSVQSCTLVVHTPYRTRAPPSLLSSNS